MEIFLIILLIISIILNLILLYLGIQKVKIIEEYELWINEIKQFALNSYMRMREVDAIGVFESDDQVGYSFQELKKIIDDFASSAIPTIKEIQNAKKNNNTE